MVGAADVTLARLAREEARVTLVWLGRQQLMPSLGNPGRNVFERTRIAGEHGQGPTNGQCLHAANQLHQWAGAEASTRVNLLIDGDCGCIRHCCNSLYSLASRWDGPLGAAQRLAK